MKNELTGSYIAHYFTLDARGNLGNEAIMPAGGKLRGADGVVHEIAPDYMPAVIVVSHGTLVLGASKDADGVITVNPQIDAKIEAQAAEGRAYRQALSERLLAQLAIAS